MAKCGLVGDRVGDRVDDRVGDCVGDEKWNVNCKGTRLPW